MSKNCKHEWLPLGNDRWSCKRCAMVKVGYIDQLQQQLVEKDKYIDKLEQEREFMLDEVKNRGTCGLCEKLEEKAINVLRDKLKEKDKEIERLKANQTPTDKELKPQEYDNYNLADKLRYRDNQVRIALERLQKLDDELFYVRHQICEKIRQFVELNEDWGTIYVCQIHEFLKELEKGE